jgi:hypothetical protein
MPERAEIIKWSVLAFTILLLILTIRHFYNKWSSSKPSSSVTIKLSLSGPGSYGTQKKDLTIPSAFLLSRTLDYFISSIVLTSKIAPWSYDNIYWKSLTVNNKEIPISAGKVSEGTGQEIVPAFLGSIPPIITISGSFKAMCNDSDKPTNCDPCKSQKAVCTDSGWACPDNSVTTCPDRSVIEHCCNSKSAPYASCDSNGKITCGDCPTDSNGKMLNPDGSLLNGSGDCGPPGCTMIGPLCTSAGWICQAGRKCPEAADLQACATPGDISTCTVDASGNTRLLSSKCDPIKNPPPECPPSCNKQGLVCNPDLTFSCVPNTTCPDQKTMNECCTDPAKPVGICSSSSTSVICQGCPIDSNGNPVGAPICLEDCLGTGLKCTADGWACLPGVKCPSNMSECCPSDSGPIHPYCDPTAETKCVKCYCEQPNIDANGNMIPKGQPGGPITSTCLEPVCGGIQALGGGDRSPSGLPFGTDVCCSSDPPCNKPMGAKDYMCCDAERACWDGTAYTCCPVGTICKDGECCPLCGNDDSGEEFACQVGETCLISENISPSNLGMLKKQLGPDNVRYDESAKTAYMCMQNNQSCTWSAFPSTFPDRAGEYQPCYSFPAPSTTDPLHPGPGYCSYQPGGSTDPAIVACNKYLDKDVCENTPTHPWQSYPGHQAYNETTPTGRGTFATVELAKAKCDELNNTAPGSCGSVVNCNNASNDGDSGITLRAGTHVPQSDGGDCTAYDRSATVLTRTAKSITDTTVCKWSDGLCVPDSAATITCAAHSINGPEACNADTTNNCKWRDTLDFMASSQNLNVLKSELVSIQGDLYGEYCSEEGKSYQRLVAINSDNDTPQDCTPLDCWTHVGQAGITDVQFVESDGSKPAYCVFTQDCNPVRSGVTNSKVSGSGIITPVKPGYNLVSDKSTVFPSCASNPPCPNLNQQEASTGLSCGENGRITPSSWVCSTETNNKSCVQSTDGSGYSSPTKCAASCCTVPFTSDDSGECYYWNYQTVGDGVTTISAPGSDGDGDWIWQKWVVPQGVKACVGDPSYAKVHNSGYTDYYRGIWTEPCQDPQGCAYQNGWVQGDSDHPFAYCPAP